jgi:hypothetical protein
MTDRPPRKGVPLVEELMAHTLLIADSAQKSLKDCQLVREEIRSTLKTFVATNTKTNTDIADQADFLKKSYAPTEVRNFKAEADKVLGRLDENAGRITRRFVVRIAITAILVGAAAAFTVGLLLQRVPTLTEIADRQTTLQRLQEQIYVFEGLKKRLVRDPEGQYYLQYDRASVKNCPPSNPNDGYCYIPIPK